MFYENQILLEDCNLSAPGAAPAITLGPEFAFPRECVVLNNEHPELQISELQSPELQSWEQSCCKVHCNKP